MGEFPVLEADIVQKVFSKRNKKIVSIIFSFLVLDPNSDNEHYRF